MQLIHVFFLNVESIRRVWSVCVHTGSEFDQKLPVIGLIFLEKQKKILKIEKKRSSYLLFSGAEK